MDGQQVRGVVNQLVEAEFDQYQAQKHLEEFRQTNDPPRAPSEFEDLQAFIDFHEQKQGYEDEMQSLQTRLNNAKEAYDQAEKTLRGILPANVPLYYDYAGERPRLEGVRFAILNQAFNRRGKIVISASGPAAQR